MYFEIMQEIGKLVPDDAVSFDLSTIDTADAINKVACAVIHARFLTKSDIYSYQLIFSRFKFFSDDLSQPKAELFAATMNVLLVRL